MTLKRLIIQSLKQNIRHYYLYVLALIFSVSLYFSFVTLQYDPALNEVSGSIKGAAAIRSASVLLFAIVAIFLLYANRIFIKRRSSEIGLFQLIGLTKDRIFGILTIENSVIYFSSLVVGIGIGFVFSKLVMMILIKITNVDYLAKLRFAPQALSQTLIVFTIVFVLIALTNYFFIRKQTILSLFHVLRSTENQLRRISVLNMIIGMIGLSLIIIGYFVSQRLFDGAFATMDKLFLAMTFILTSVIIGTYFFFKGSVSFILNLIRKHKKGYLSIKHVLGLSSLMFRMKSNSLLLTIITTVSALAIGLLSLSYITYYSADKNAEQNVVTDFAFTTEQAAEQFSTVLTQEGIDYERIVREVIYVEADIDGILTTPLDLLNEFDSSFIVPVVSEEVVEHMEVDQGEVKMVGDSPITQSMLAFKNEGELVWLTKETTISQEFTGMIKDTILPYTLTSGGLPTAIVTADTFEQLANQLDNDQSVFIGIEITDRDQLEQANQHLTTVSNEFGSQALSRISFSQEQKQSMGLIMFIVGFLGLTFLITSGCILYFKQMDESELEKGNYTILRKLGFTEADLTKGIIAKQFFNFGIPLILGLSHSYFAVQSGWFFFGTELWTPMLAVMVLYTALYSCFGLLSVAYYRQVIHHALSYKN
ncbi:ABC transporter permease [Amphibacillus sediminis]|uniref:ABC transporter permease n=1 Tax=Amphibacillus sediminis TaxID=360185 RepID=UPI0008379866|nr:ABC transporter permease [Amphibacillus sediminis]